MGQFKPVRGTLKSFVNFKGWIGYDSLKSQTQTLFQVISPAFKTAKATHEESFEEAVTRLNLNPNALNQKADRFFKQALIFLATAFCIFIYGIYLFISHAPLSGFIALVITILALIRSAVAHFYYFQIRRKKLGCSIREWFFAFFKRNGHE